MLLFMYVGNGFQLAPCNVSWLATRESVVLVPDLIVFTSWSVRLDRGEPCDSCQDTPHVVVLCFFCPMAYHKSTGRAISSRQRSTGCSRSWSGRTARRAEPRNTRPTATPGALYGSHNTVLPYRVKVFFFFVTSLAVLLQWVGSLSEDGRPRCFFVGRFTGCVMFVFSVANRQVDCGCCAEAATSLATGSRSF